MVDQIRGQIDRAALLQPAELVVAQAALAAGDWQAARDGFEAALRGQASAEAHDGLGLALWWLNEIPAAQRQRGIAYRLYRQQGQAARAALLAAWLGREQLFLHGNAGAMNGWFRRAQRLLAGEGPCVERGWFLLLRASLLAPPAELEEAARQALAIAEAFADADLETLARGFAGTAHVSCGRVAEGMADLEEALAAATGGEVDDLAVVSELFCLMLSACDLAGDPERTEAWCRTAAAFAERRQSAFLAAYCRTTYGGLLTAAGRWRDAEAELLAAMDAFAAGHRGLRVHAVLRLADLRVRQGRLEEAEALLAGHEDQAGAFLPLVRLSLARGEAGVARAMLRNVLPADGPLAIDQAPALALLVDAALAAGELDGAEAAAEQLRRLAEQIGSELLLAQAALAAGRVQRHAGDARAAASLRTALASLRSHEQSLVAGRTRLELGQLLRESDRPGAVAWARAALATFERLGAEHDAAQAVALLRSLGVAARPGPRTQAELTLREREVLALVAKGLANREIAERLCISAKTAEHHVSRVLAKLGARTRAEAAAMAAQLGTTAAK